jgi:hypothetical protein
MRGDIVYRVYGVHEGRERDCNFGTFRTRAGAEVEIAKLKAREGGDWAAKYHSKGFVVREATVETGFEIPAQPKPRDKYAIRVTETSPPGAWRTIRVDVLRRDLDSGSLKKICSYDRRYSMLHTFEPFRQGDKEFALISRNYTSTDVLDLGTGNVVAMEPESASGFCPVGFYVPDWWDIRTGMVIPGSEGWNADHEWPTGHFGFVWGCHWGDDTSWKVQYLDLSRIQDGVITRDDRFGYVELATDTYKPPWLDLEAKGPSAPPPFIRVSRHEGVLRVSFDVEMEFDLVTGKPEEWERRRIANFE